MSGKKRKKNNLQQIITPVIHKHSHRRHDRRSGGGCEEIAMYGLSGLWIHVLDTSGHHPTMTDHMIPPCLPSPQPISSGSAPSPILRPSLHESDIVIVIVIAIVVVGGGDHRSERHQQSRKRSNRGHGVRPRWLEPHPGSWERRDLETKCPITSSSSSSSSASNGTSISGDERSQVLQVPWPRERLYLNRPEARSRRKGRRAGSVARAGDQGLME